MNYVKLFFSILVCQFAGVIGSVFTMSSVSSWYVTLNKPFFNPPSFVFGPVWIFLYLLMGISLYIIWNDSRGGRVRRIALIVFFVQLCFNSLWSIVFFGLQSPFFAFLVILILLIFIVVTIFYFYKISKVAAYLLVPYVLWVVFASVLNLSIFLLN